MSASELGTSNHGYVLRVKIVANLCNFSHFRWILFCMNKCMNRCYLCMWRFRGNRVYFRSIHRYLYRVNELYSLNLPDVINELVTFWFSEWSSISWRQFLPLSNFVLLLCAVLHESMLYVCLYFKILHSGSCSGNLHLGKWSCCSYYLMCSFSPLYWKTLISQSSYGNLQ